MNDTTRRYPRTLAEAFGPYHNLAPLQVDYLPLHKHDKIVLVGCFIAACLLGVVLILNP